MLTIIFFAQAVALFLSTYYTKLSVDVYFILMVDVPSLNYFRKSCGVVHKAQFIILRYTVGFSIDNLWGHFPPS
jgi:hypothetical protein